MKYIIWIIFVFYFLDVAAQNHFIKIIDFDSLSQSSQQIIKQGDHYLLGYYQTCKSDLESQCSGVIKIDEAGNVLDKVWLEKFSNNPNSILMTEDRLLLTGEVFNFGVDAHEFLINVLDMEKLDSISTYKVFSPTKPFVKMFQLSGTVWKDKYVVGGNGRIIESSYNRGTVYIVNKDFTLDTLLYFDFANKNISCWNTFVDRSNQLNVCLQYGHDSEDYTSIMKYDTSYNLVWQWRSPDQLSAKALPHGFENGNKEIIINLDDPLWAFINQIHCIKPDSSLKWTSKWSGNYSGQTRLIDRLHSAKNGDLIGVGRFGNLKFEPRLESVPFIFRIDSNGNFKWIKVYYKDQEYKNGGLVQGGFSDVIETENGDLIAVGRIHNVLEYDPKVNGPRNDWDIIVARLGADGCLEPGCGDINKIDIKTDVKDLLVHDENINVYPNPSIDGEFMLEIDDHKPIDKCTVEIFDISGRKIMQLAVKESLSQFFIQESGMYFIKVSDNNHVLHYQKIVKI